MRNRRNRAWGGRYRQKEQDRRNAKNKQMGGRGVVEHACTTSMEEIGAKKERKNERKKDQYGVRREFGWLGWRYFERGCGRLLSIVHAVIAFWLLLTLLAYPNLTNLLRFQKLTRIY